jgi:hypothetical protein
MAHIAQRKAASPASAQAKNRNTFIAAKAQCKQHNRLMQFETTEPAN